MRVFDPADSESCMLSLPDRRSPQSSSVSVEVVESRSLQCFHRQMLTSANFRISPLSIVIDKTPAKTKMPRHLNLLRPQTLTAAV